MVYRYTVEDDELYTRPWTGEFSLTRHDDEYACHEGNYSMPTILAGGQAEADQLSRQSQERGYGPDVALTVLWRSFAVDVGRLGRGE